MDNLTPGEHRWVGEADHLCANCGVDAGNDEAEKPCIGTGELHLYMTPDGGEWVIAHTQDDAWRAREEQTGEERDDFRDNWWVELKPHDQLEIYVDPDDGVPTDPEDSGARPLTLTAAEWVARRGRGWLCTSER